MVKSRKPLYLVVFNEKSLSNERLLVVPLGLEPRLFWTKTRRVASYTMGQFHNVPSTTSCINVIERANINSLF